MMKRATAAAAAAVAGGGWRVVGRRRVALKPGQSLFSQRDSCKR